VALAPPLASAREAHRREAETPKPWTPVDTGCRLVPFGAGKESLNYGHLEGPGFRIPYPPPIVRSATYRSDQRVSRVLLRLDAFEGSEWRTLWPFVLWASGQHVRVQPIHRSRVAGALGMEIAFGLFDGRMARPVPHVMDRHGGDSLGRASFKRPCRERMPHGVGLTVSQSRLRQ